MQRVKAYLRDFSEKLKSVKVHLKESMTLLNDIALDMVEKTLMGAEVQVHAVRAEVGVVKGEHACQQCGLACASAGGLAKHVKSKHAT
jgi:hypothetical protein